MQNMPMLQLSVLRAVCMRNEIMVNGEALRVCLDIMGRQSKTGDITQEEPYKVEIRKRLIQAGLSNNGKLPELST